MKLTDLAKKSFMPLLSMAVALILIPSCGLNYGHPWGMGPGGGLFSQYTIGLSGSKVDAPNIKEARSCQQNILGYFTFGDGSIQKTAGQGRINTIYTVNKEIFNVLTIYSRNCTVVRGVEGGQPAAVEDGGVQSANFRDLVILKSGQRFENVKAAVTSDSVVITTSDGRTMVFSKSEVQSVRKGN